MIPRARFESSCFGKTMFRENTKHFGQRRNEFQGGDMNLPVSGKHKSFRANTKWIALKGRHAFNEVVKPLEIGGFLRFLGLPGFRENTNHFGRIRNEIQERGVEFSCFRKSMFRENINHFGRIRNDSQSEV
jgi:hypothetical protein